VSFEIKSTLMEQLLIESNLCVFELFIMHIPFCQERKEGKMVT
jgi:hypothetical protein